MSKKKIVLISSFAQDRITYLESFDKTETRKGGPALWISNVLKRNRADFKIITGDKKSEIDIVVANNEETGKIVSVCSISKTVPKVADMFIVSTIANEYNIRKLNSLNGIIAVDIQGYVRKYKKIKQKLSISRKIAEKIFILKATSDEIQFINSDFINGQKKRILLITNGKYGFELYVKGLKYIYKTKKILAKNTVGAGDTFFSAFCVNYLKNKDVFMAVKYAKKYVEEFLLQK